MIRNMPRRAAELAAARVEIESLRAQIQGLQSEKDGMAAELSMLRLYLERAAAGLRPDPHPGFEDHLDTVRYLVMAAEYRDHDTGAHLVRIGYFSALLAPACGCDAGLTRRLMLAGPMHDVGKIGIPDRILKKRGLLSGDERRTMKRHAEYGARILADPDAPVLRLASEIALTHHEYFDGSGYPRGLKGREIPLTSRIVAVVDVFDALAMDRTYRPAMAVEQALDLIRGERGRQFDPDVVDAFFGVLDPILALRDRLNRGERPEPIPGLTDGPKGSPLDFYASPLNCTPEFLGDRPYEYEC
ncbi:MAG: HD domain-containing protein [Rhodocyclales bacterium]|nr:HD domain-containing protein [Rhodocyclales bacterium]